MYLVDLGLDVRTCAGVDVGVCVCVCVCVPDRCVGISVPRVGVDVDVGVGIGICINNYNTYYCNLKRLFGFALGKIY